MFKTIELPRLETRTRALLACVGAGSLFLVSSTNPSSAACPQGVQWKQIGPASLVIDPADSADGQGPDSGMVRDIAIDPSGTSDQVIYVATDNGGIWKTTDGGTNWCPKTDFMPSLNMGAVALDPGNASIVYAGTGNEYNQSYFNGAGIYKSIDGGDTWVVLGANIFTNVAINRIVLPAHDLLIIASGNGVYRSTDGDTNFSFLKSGRATDLDVDTASSTTVYASISGSGVFKSTDSGATFPSAGNAFTAANGAFTANDGTTTTIGYIAFAQSTQPDNQTMYANVQLTSGGPTMVTCDGTTLPGSSAMLKSIDGGNHRTY